MKVNKIGIILGFLIIGGMFTFVLSIDTETMCNEPYLSNTITTVNISNVVVIDGYEVCRWVDNDMKLIAISENVI